MLNALSSTFYKLLPSEGEFRGSTLGMVAGAARCRLPFFSLETSMKRKNAHIELFSFFTRPCWEWLCSMMYQYIYFYLFKYKAWRNSEAEDSNKYIALSSWPIFGRINCETTVNHTDELRCRCEKRKILLRNEKLRVWKNKSLLSFYEGDLNSSNTPSTERNFIWNSTSRRRPGAWCNGLTKGNYLNNHQS